MKHCRQTVSLISQRADRQLTWREAALSKIHLLICPKCRRYAKQLRFIQNAVKNLNQPDQ